jgi:hypothetical protein
MGHKVDSCNTDLHKLFYTPSLKLLYHNFFAESLLFIIERRGGAAPLMTKVTSLRRTMKMKN